MSEVVELLSRLIRVDTHNPGGDEGALAQLLAGELSRRGADEVLRADVPRSGAIGAYVLARWGTPRLLLNAHIDTVPPNAGWSGDPYTPRRVTVDGTERVVGLGACDTKGAIAAILSALDETRPRDLAVLFSGDEEHAGSCMRAFVQTGHLAGVEQAIVCEPTSCRAGTRHRGMLALEAQLDGHGGHSSRADELPAPLAELARLATAWADWGISQRPLGPEGFRGMCLNIAQLDGGIAFNVVPDGARLTMSVRPPPGGDMRAVRETLAAMARALVPAARLSAPVENPPFATRDLAAFRPWLGALCDAPVDLAFWTEAAVLSEHGVDAVVYGPGSIAQAHAPDEWVPVAELEAARALFTRAIRAAAGKTS
jgi:acetylornithine deacetylase